MTQRRRVIKYTRWQNYKERVYVYGLYTYNIIHYKRYEPEKDLLLFYIPGTTIRIMRRVPKIKKK